ncbi:MAG: hypothetical protein JWO36_1550 [Myxococcales bacterium]|nr:hypothetical protein [Myxococcales bacterium]
MTMKLLGISVAVAALLGGCGTSDGQPPSARKSPSKPFALPVTASPAADLSSPATANASIYGMVQRGDKDGLRRALSKRVAASFSAPADFEAWFAMWQHALEVEPTTKALRLVEEDGQFKLDEK